MRRFLYPLMTQRLLIKFPRTLDISFDQDKHQAKDHAHHKTSAKVRGYMAVPVSVLAEMVMVTRNRRKKVISKLVISLRATTCRAGA